MSISSRMLRFLTMLALHRLRLSNANTFLQLESWQQKNRHEKGCFSTTNVSLKPGSVMSWEMKSCFSTATFSYERGFCFCLFSEMD